MQVARGIGVHRNTVRKYIRRYGINHQYSTISNEDLDVLVQEFRDKNPHLGLRFLMSYVSRQHLRIQKQRLRDSVERVDPVSSRLVLSVFPLIRIQPKIMWDCMLTTSDCS
jgi:hypothetical protein